jgi:hypothetical protein
MLAKFQNLINSMKIELTLNTTKFIENLQLSVAIETGDRDKKTEEEPDQHS